MHAHAIGVASCIDHGPFAARALSAMDTRRGQLGQSVSHQSLDARLSSERAGQHAPDVAFSKAEPSQGGAVAATSAPRHPENVVVAAA